jgi:hypothetical protein
VFLWRDPASRIVAGNTGDPDQAAWWMRYAATAVAHWRLPGLITTGMNAPAGVNAMWNPSLLAPGVALSPVTLLAGPQVSLNLLLTAGFAGSATSMFWVLRRWGIGGVAAAFGGLAYGFSPALYQSAIGHYDLQFAVLPPLIVHALLRLPRSPLRSGAALGLLAALQLLSAEELLFATGVAIAAGLVVAGVSRVRSAPSKETVLAVTSGLMMAAGVFIMVAGYPLWTQFLGPLAQHGSPYTIGYFKNDLAGLVRPSTLQVLHFASSASFVAKYPGGPAEYLGYLGWPLLLVIVWMAGALWSSLAARALAVTFVVLEVCALGGTLLLNGYVHAWLKLPWYWVQALPLAGSVIPDRFSIVADGCAAALLAIMIDMLWRSWGRRSGRWRATIVLGALVAVVPLLPAPLPATKVAGVPAGWSTTLGSLRLPSDASVLVVPVPTGSFSTPLRWQAASGVPSSLVGGYFIGPAPGGQAYVGGPGLPTGALYLNWLWLESGPGAWRSDGIQVSGRVPAPGAMSAWINSSGVSAVVAVTSYRSPLASYLSSLLGKPAVESATVIAWRVPGAG